MIHRARAVLALVVLVALAAACGQKEGVHVSSGQGGGGGDGVALDGTDGFDDGDGGTGFEPGDPADPATGGGAGDPAADPGAGGGDPGAAGGGGSGGGGGAGGGGAGGAGAGGGGGQATVGDTITIGVHAPITGAAPLPASFAQAARVYPDFINGKGGINGRQLRVVVVDDEYQPATASRKCTELVQREKAFLLVGGGGTDQIQACARTAASLGVPYLSAGVTERGLRGLRNYFALSMSYPEQGPMLASFMKKEFPDLVDKPAMVYSNTPNFGDARDAFFGAMSGVTEIRLPRSPSQSDLARAAQQMCAEGVKIAYPLMAPADWLFLANQANPICDIQWSGVGLTMGLNTVASTGCRNRAIDGATFFSPFPGIDKAPELDPEFAQAVQGKNWDDIYVALWGTTKAIGELLRATGDGLNPGSFVSTTEQTQGLKTGLNPVLSFTPDDHFGADTVHVLRADCSQGQYVTMATFAKY